jgi:hypothetical protein
MKHEEGPGDRRTISMPLFVYNTDLAKAESAGEREAMRRFVRIMEAVKLDPRDAVCMVVETFEDDQPMIDRMLKALGLFEKAQEIWNEGVKQ